MRYKKKSKPVSQDFVILYDDRENFSWQLPWEMKEKRLKVGDYSVEGYEKVVAIEKKSGFGELFKNLTAKERPRFDRFLRRLSRYPIKCIIVEDELGNLERVYRLIKRKAPKMRLTPKTITYWMSKTIVEYGIPILFIPKATKRFIIVDIFKEVLKQCSYIKKP